MVFQREEHIIKSRAENRYRDCPERVVKHGIEIDSDLICTPCEVGKSHYDAEAYYDAVPHYINSEKAKGKTVYRKFAYAQPGKGYYGNIFGGIHIIFLLFTFLLADGLDYTHRIIFLIEKLGEQSHDIIICHPREDIAVCEPVEPVMQGICEGFRQLRGIEAFDI